MLDDSNVENGDSSRKDQSKKGHPKRHHSGDEPVQTDATPCEDLEEKCSDNISRNSLKNQEKCDVLRGHARKTKIWAEGLEPPTC